MRRAIGLGGPSVNAQTIASSASLPAKRMMDFVPPGWFKNLCHAVDVVARDDLASCVRVAIRHVVRQDHSCGSGFSANGAPA